MKRYPKKTPEKTDSYGNEVIRCYRCDSDVPKESMKLHSISCAKHRSYSTINVWHKTYRY